MPDSHQPEPRGSQIGDYRLSTSCGIVERPDHHCADDLVGVCLDPASVGCRRSSSSASITKWVGRISQERFDPESPNFRWTSIPTNSIVIPDMTSLAPFGRHLSKFDKTAENAASDGFLSNFSGAVCCLTQIIGGLLVRYLVKFYAVTNSFFSRPEAASYLYPARLFMIPF